MVSVSPPILLGQSSWWSMLQLLSCHEPCHLIKQFQMIIWDLDKSTMISLMHSFLAEFSSPHQGIVRSPHGDACGLLNYSTAAAWPTLYHLMSHLRVIHVLIFWNAG